MTDAASAHGAPADSGVGARLRAAREAAGLDIKQLAARTRVTSRHLEALEGGDYAALPGRPYALGFGRSYARAVGLDETAIADAIRSELDTQAPPPPPRVIHQFEVGDPQKTPSRLVNWLALLAVVVIVGLGLMFWRSAFWPAAELPPLVGPEQPAPAVRPEAAPPATRPAPALQDGPVVFTALEDGIWVKFYDGAGKQLMQKQMAKGEAYTVPADAADPKLWTGRPDALAITVAGREVARIAETQGIVKDVAVSGRALLARGMPQPAPSAAPPPGAPSSTG